MNQLYTREGSTDFRAAPGARVGVAWKPCGRCGGQGWRPEWAYTEYTCYECGGHRGRTISVTLYTADELEVLNTRRDALRAKKAQKDAAAYAKAQAEAAAKAAAAKADLTARGLGDAVALAASDASGRDLDLIRDLVEKHARYGLSDAQVDLLGSVLRQRAERAQAAAKSAHVGAVGERLTFTARLDACPSFETDFGVMYINILRDEAGNVIVYKGSKRMAEKGETITFKATVKAHDVREGVNQTVVARPAI